MTVFTTDVSHHDWDRHGGALDWVKIHASGIQAMCAKATEGDPAGYNFADIRFAAHCKAARSAGITLAGGYHCVSHGDQASINRQVDWLRRRLDEIGGLGTPGVWAMIDVEPFPELVDRGIAPRWDDVLRFADRWHAVTGGYPLAVYLPKWVWAGNLGSPAMTALRGPLVSSDYGNNAAVGFETLYAQRGGATGWGWTAYGGKTPELWQYGSQAKVPGASPASDVNAYKGTLQQLTARLTGATVHTTEEADMPLTDAQDHALSEAWSTSQALQTGADAPAASSGRKAGPAWLVQQIAALRADVAALKTQLAALAATDQVNEGEVAKQVLAGLTPAGIADAVVEALPGDLAAQLLDELAARLKTPPTA